YGAWGRVVAPAGLRRVRAYSVFLGRTGVQEQGVRDGAYGGDKFGFRNLAEVRWNLREPALYEYAISAGEAGVVIGGGLCAETGHHTGRSPKDKHTVVDHLPPHSLG